MCRFAGQVLCFYVYKYTIIALAITNMIFKFHRIDMRVFIINNTTNNFTTVKYLRTKKIKQENSPEGCIEHTFL